MKREGSSSPKLDQLFTITPVWGWAVVSSKNLGEFAYTAPSGILVSF
jgi:hypothetical protein